MTLESVEKRYIVFLMLFLIDGYLTYFGLSSGRFIELNPFVNFMILEYGLLFSTIALKSFFTIILYVVSFKIFKYMRIKKVPLEGISFFIFNLILNIVLLFYVGLIILELLLLSGVLIL